MFYLIRKESRVDAFSHTFWTTHSEMLVTTFPLVQQFVSRGDSVRSPSEYISLHLYLCKTEWQGRGWVWVGQSYVTPCLIPPLVRQVKLERVCFHFIKLAFGLFTSVLRTFKHPFFLPLQQREREGAVHMSKGEIHMERWIGSTCAAPSPGSSSTLHSLLSLSFFKPSLLFSFILCTLYP